MTALSRRLLAVLFAMLLLVAACGGDDDTGGDDNDTNTTQADDGGGDEGSDDGSSDNGDDGSSDNGDDGSSDNGDGDGLGALDETCLEAVQAVGAAMSQYSTGIAEVFGGTLDEAEFEAAAEQLQAMAEAAPAEIQDDLAVIADGLQDFYQALADSGYVAGQTPSPEQIEELSALSESLDSEAFQEAGDNITAWFEANCEQS
jgi:hypothetical protein